MKKLLFLSLLFLTACSMAVQKPTVALKDVRFAGLNGDGISLNFLLDVTNPNTFDLPLQGYSYEVRLMTLPLARGESKDSLSFYGKTSTDMLIPVRVSYADILEIIKHNPGLKEIPYQLHANLNLGTPLGAIAVPVTKGGTVTVPKQYQPDSLLRKFGDLLNRGAR
ncbi:MAG: LEA type 2 family protein [Geobacteraceae bacterium]|nr:LEA type 2 family protein [Geobacteraceae bacterium]